MPLSVLIKAIFSDCLRSTAIFIRILVAFGKSKYAARCIKNWLFILRPREWGKKFHKFALDWRSWSLASAAINLRFEPHEAAALDPEAQIVLKINFVPLVSLFIAPKEWNDKFSYIKTYQNLIKMNETHAQHFRSPTLHILTPTRMSFIFIDSNVIEFFPFIHSFIPSVEVLLMCYTIKTSNCRQSATIYRNTLLTIRVFPLSPHTMVVSGKLFAC